MGQVVYHQFPSYTTTWTFKCRNKDVFFTPEMVKEIREQIEAYCSLRFTEDELDYGLLRNLTVTEILKLGDYMGLPSELVHKTPSDGLCGKTDEDNLGITYERIDDYITNGVATDEDKELIRRKYKANLHKSINIPCPYFYHEYDFGW